MHFIDTHTHLYKEEFDQDRDAVIKRANDLGILNFVLPAIDSTHTPEMDRLKSEYPKQMHLMTGLHPTQVKEDTYKSELKHVADRLGEKSFTAVGEIGIDLYWDKSTLNIQKEAFKTQIQWAKKNKLPIVIHCRDAFEETFEVLESEHDDDLYGAFHCFTGTLEQAKKALSFNLKLGIGGVATFKNGKIDQFLKEIPIQEIILETDAPYLAPAPYRGKRNESAYLLKIAQKIAHIYNIPLEEVAKITSANTLQIFDLNTD
ncbi:TatD family hydrolase [Flavimarina sp. Hel_I_48]|uniref:TatD family hydrolase n=1 Tax=Flavimarina sp. Hel_I_48 TaxID=1392488 RepID=UPI0004DF1D02|nr:TatD family hydrolase [Flavimarina sp. Hel_I_48]